MKGPRTEEMKGPRAEETKGPRTQETAEGAEETAEGAQAGGSRYLHTATRCSR